MFSSISRFINYLYCSILVVIYCTKKWIKFFRSQIGLCFIFKLKVTPSYLLLVFIFFYQSLWFIVTHYHFLLLSHSLSLVVISCHSLYHSLSLVVIDCNTRCHSATRCHSLSFVVPLVFTRCQSMPLNLSFFYKRSCPTLHHATLTFQNLKVFTNINKK